MKDPRSTTKLLLNRLLGMGQRHQQCDFLTIHLTVFRKLVKLCNATIYPTAMKRVYS